jgi:hypothetical protein
MLAQQLCDAKSGSLIAQFGSMFSASCYVGSEFPIFAIDNEDLKRVKLVRAKR